MELTLQLPEATVGPIFPERSMTLLNSLGDVTIIWSAEKDAEVKAMIADKLAKGIRFFVIAKIPFVPLYRRTNVSDPAKLGERRVQLDDAQLEALVNGGVQLAKAGTTTMEFVKATKNVQEIATTNTVAMPQMVGG